MKTNRPLSAATAALTLALWAAPAHAAPMGHGCAKSSDCDVGATTCLKLTAAIGVCSTSCSPDDPSTPLVNEDTCASGFVCGSRPASPTYKHCLTACKPSLSANPCPASSKLTCDPRSMRQAKAKHSVCLEPACTGPADCPVFLKKTCKAAADCAGLSPDAYCKLPQGWCARPGVCSPGGICGPHGKGKATAKVGDPCTDDRDCPDAGRCLMDVAGDPHGMGIPYPSGYCTIAGCAFAALLAPFACPGGSTCHWWYDGGLCHKTCMLNQAGDCRSHPKDRGGDYDCYAWNNLMLGSTQVAKEPLCANAGGVGCTVLGSSVLDCSALGNKNNPTNMQCRDRTLGTIKSNKKDPTGVCLDDTASGPFGPPPPDAGPPDQGVKDLPVGSDQQVVDDVLVPGADAARTDGAPPTTTDDDGCGCRIDGPTYGASAPTPLLLVLVLLFAARRRRAP